jgi:multicomponent Na+:H+ antiporter subunit G
MTVLLNWLGAGLIVFGAGFVFVAALGLVRLPDLILRMHAATKAGTLGAGTLLVAVALLHGEGGMATRAIAGVAFLMLTSPIAAHAIGRAAYRVGIELWPETVEDELRGKYHPETGALAGHPAPRPAGPAPAPPPLAH